MPPDAIDGRDWRPARNAAFLAEIRRRYRNIVTNRVLPAGHEAQRFGVVACRSAARHQISRVRGSEGEVVVSEEELGDLFKRYASYVATIGIRLAGT